MKNVAATINEKKRRLEGLQQIVLWQMNVEGWRVGIVLFKIIKCKVRSEI